MKKDAIAIIPARGGSKRIPKKNIKEFFGKPLIAYSIEVALASKLFEKVVVSTDDEEIAKIAKKYGAEVPFLRPKNLSDDFTGTQDVINHAIKYFEAQGENYDYVCTIYATAPLLQKEYLIEGYNKLKQSDAINTFSATTMPFPIQRTFKLDENGRCKMFMPEHYMTRSQDLEEAYQDAGQFYFENRKLAKESNRSVMFSDISIPIILPRHLVQDIDTLEDWKRVEFMYQALHQDQFDKWNKLKKYLDTNTKNINIKNKDIYLVQIGKNIGAETYGKGDNFLRPVLVFKKLGHNYFLGIPLTSGKKNGNYFFNFRYKKNKDSCAMLNQMKIFDAKRILKLHGKISNNTFRNLKLHIKDFFEFSPQINEGECQLGLKSLHKEIEISIPKKSNNVK